MTGEPTHTTSKERMAPEFRFLFEHVLQLSIIDSKVTMENTGDFCLQM